MEQLIKYAVNYGLGVVLSIAILFLAKYLLTKVFEQHKEERQIWLKLMDEHFRTQANAHEYQRKEHEQILIKLQKLNGND